MTGNRHAVASRIPPDATAGPHTGTAPSRPFWSFTKTVIAICALRLAERGRLDLDEPCDDEPFTLCQLLNHTAGLPDYAALPANRQAVAADAEPWPRDRLIAAARAEGPLFPPGRGWSHSNLGYRLARDRAEAAGDRSLAGPVDDLSARPLGLESLAMPRMRAPCAAAAPEAAPPCRPGWVYHGCLTGSAGDAARMLHALFAGRLLKPGSLGQMLARIPLGGGLAGRPWTDCGYGLGLMHGAMGAAGRAIGHSGGGPSGVCAVYHFLDRPVPVTVAAFAGGTDEGRAESAAAAAVTDA